MHSSSKWIQDLLLVRFGQKPFNPRIDDNQKVFNEFNPITEPDINFFLTVNVLEWEREKHKKYFIRSRVDTKFKSSNFFLSSFSMMFPTMWSKCCVFLTRIAVVVFVLKKSFLFVKHIFRIVFNVWAPLWVGVALFFILNIRIERRL